jgi:hypothetical protein
MASQQITNIHPHDRMFKSRLDRLEKDITILRVSSAADLEKANLNIRRIADDIDKREKRFTSLQTPALRPRAKPPVQFESPIAEFEHFLCRNGGRTGGWDGDSHAEFIRQLQRHGPAHLTEYLPTIPEESILAHIQWYNEFKVLKQQMKAALNQFREKQNRRVEPDDESPESPRVEPTVVLQRLDERRKAKEQRALEAAEAAEEARRAEEQARKSKFTKLKQELMRRKTEEPEPVKETPPELIEIDTRKQFRQEDWEKIKKRDDAMRERKSAVKQAQEGARLEREARQKKLADKNAKKFKHAKRDPERLMQPTAAIRARIDADDKEPKGPVNSVFMIPHRATPAWMM